MKIVKSENVWKYNVSINVNAMLVIANVFKSDVCHWDTILEIIDLMFWGVELKFGTRARKQGFQAPEEHYV